MRDCSNYPTAAAEFEQSLIPQRAKGAKHRVGVDPEDRGEVPRRGKTVTRPGLTGRDGSPDGRGHLLMQRDRTR
jgi:hypothetical protein